jgi:AcrR family transcriptional regulator
MPADKKGEILDAAGKCFARFGYEKATMDDIGELVGMNKVSLYYYFKNKEALFKEMLIREADEYTARMRRKAGEAQGCRKKIKTWLDLSFQYGRNSSILHQTSMETLRKLSPLLEEFRLSSFETSVGDIAAFLDEGMTEGEIRRCDTAKVAESIVKIANALKDAAYKRYKDGSGEAPDFEGVAADVGFAVELILDGLAASPADRGGTKPRGGKK